MATAAGDAAGRGSGRVNSNIVGTALRLCGVRCRHRQGRGRGRSTGTEKDFARFARRLLSTLVRKAFAAATSLPTRTRARKSRSPSQVRRNHGPALGLDTAANPCGWADESYNSAQMDEAECRVYCQTLRRSLKACRCPAELRQPPGKCDACTVQFAHACGRRPAQIGRAVKVFPCCSYRVTPKLSRHARANNGA
jgi:hypothetical protein